MKEKREYIIDDTPMNLSNVPEMTDEEYERFKAEMREYVAKAKKNN